MHKGKKCDILKVLKNYDVYIYVSVFVFLRFFLELQICSFFRHLKSQFIYSLLKWLFETLLHEGLGKGPNLVKKNKNMVNIVKTLVSLGLVRNEKEEARLSAMTMSQLMREFVFPQVLCLPRSGIRYPRISDSFMKLMTIHGKDFLAADHYLGAVLLECAMQRITKHPDLPAINYREMLPKEFQAYAASAINPDGLSPCPDEPGLWGSAEVEFITQMLPTCLQRLAGEYQSHAQIILFQILTLVKNGEVMWLDNPSYCCLTQKEVYDRACNMLFDYKLEREFVDYCVEHGWREGMSVFASWRFAHKDIDYLLSKIDLDKEKYFEGVDRTFMKVFGLYNQKTKDKIMDELIHSK